MAGGLPPWLEKPGVSNTASSGINGAMGGGKPSNGIAGKGGTTTSSSSSSPGGGFGGAIARRLASKSGPSNNLPNTPAKAK